MSEVTDKKTSRGLIAAAIIVSVIAVALAAFAVLTVAKNRSKAKAEPERETEAWHYTGKRFSRKEETEDVTLDSFPSETLPPEESLEPDSEETAEPAQTEAEETAESLETEPTETEPQEPATEATVPEPEPEVIDFGVLGYDLTQKASTDSSLAGGSFDNIIINEICAKSKSSLKDSDGDYPDWIELYNPSDSAVSLSGCGLSDDPENPLKWVFPSVNIQPKGRLVVFCSDKNTTEKELHTSFKISSGNELITLCSPKGEVIDSVVISESDEDVTFGRYPEGSSSFKLLSATPGRSNDESKSNREAALASPVFSRESGFYGEKFSLSISAQPGCTIYYTTDGSDPTTSSTKYEGEITVKDRSSEKAVLTYIRGTTVDQYSEEFPEREFEKATIIRAVAIDKNGKASGISTATYFIGDSIAKKYKDVAVISVVTDPDNLFNQKTGIYVAGDYFKEWRKENPYAELDGSAQGNFSLRGREWERPVHLDFFKGNKLEFSEDCGMRIHGGWSRNSQQKSLKFYMRSDYGSSKLKYELFEDNTRYSDGEPIDEYKRFMIRNGGNDNFTLLYKDAWTQDCVEDMAFSTQATELAICFLDGEYWGIYTITEVISDKYVEENYGVDSDNVVLIKVGSLEAGDEGDEALWYDQFNFVAYNDMSVASNYKKACEYFDMQSLSDYLAMEIYINNEDWTWNNWAAWRAKNTSDAPYEDGKWRFMVYDTEFSMDLYNHGDDFRMNLFNDLLKGDGQFGPILSSLLKNKDFKKMFVLSLEGVMNVELNPDSAGDLLYDYFDEYSPYMAQHFQRFTLWQQPEWVEGNVWSFSQWLKNRYNYMPEMMNNALSLGTKNTNDLKISLSDRKGGSIEINGLPITFGSGSWKGHYFAGYEITIEAVPASGYEFTGWSGDYESSSAKITIDPTKALSLKANFKKKG